MVPPNEQAEAEKKRKLVHGGLMVAGMAAAAVGARGTFKGLRGITKAKKGAVRKTASSLGLTAVGAATALHSSEALKSPYKHQDTPSQY